MSAGERAVSSGTGASTGEVSSGITVSRVSFSRWAIAKITLALTRQSATAAVMGAVERRLSGGVACVVPVVVLMRPGFASLGPLAPETLASLAV
jgi:hypothetical protein